MALATSIPISMESVARLTPIATNHYRRKERSCPAWSMTILIVPMIPPVPQVEALSADAVVITLQQILIGIG